MIILESGTCVPSTERNAPAYYLENSGRHILIDCGSGALRQLELAGKSYKDIDAVFMTHSHPDHAADLLPLIQALLATPGFRREKPLDIFCAPGFASYYTSAVASSLGSVAFDINIQEITERDLGQWHITAAPVMHASDSIAYRFESVGRAIVFTGDTDYNEAIVQLARNADVLVADCSFPDSEKAQGHLSAGECGTIAQRAGVRRLILSHIYPSDVPDQERVRQSSVNFSGDTILASDLMTIKV